MLTPLYLEDATVQITITGLEAALAKARNDELAAMSAKQAAEGSLSNALYELAQAKHWAAIGRWIAEHAQLGPDATWIVVAPTMPTGQSFSPAADVEALIDQWRPAPT